MITRRLFVAAAAGGAAAAGWKLAGLERADFATRSGSIPAFSITPVVGDGKWIWNKPPADETGYLEPRSYDVEIGMELEGIGSNTPFMATTPAPTSVVPPPSATGATRRMRARRHHAHGRRRTR